jgi:hypothetical protein
MRRIFLVTTLALATVAAVSAQPAERAPAPAEAVRNWPSLPAEENAAPIVLEVADDWVQPALRTTAPRIDEKAVDLEEFAPQQERQVRAWLAHWKGQLDRLDAIDRCRGFDWGEPPASPMVMAPADARRELGIGFIGTLLKLDGLAALSDGDVGRAWRRAKQMRFISDGLDAWPDSGVRSLSRRMDRQACELLVVLARHQRLSVLLIKSLPEVDQVIAHLIDDSSMRARYRRAMQVEAAFALDAAACLNDGRITAEHRKGTSSGSAAAPMVAGGFDANQIASVAELSAGYEELIRPGEAFSRSFMRTVWEERIPRRFRWQARTLVALDKAGPLFAEERDALMELLSRRRLAATALAAGAYRAQHAGKWPDSLDQLVPHYLPSVPIDPLANEKKTLGYRGGAAPVIWSTGRDGRDHNGAEANDSMTYSQKQQTDLLARLSSR